MAAADSGPLAGGIELGDDVKEAVTLYSMAQLSPSGRASAP
jgi:hypothetical protein